MTPGFHCFIMQELFTTPQGLNWHQLRWVAVSILLVLRCEALEDSPGDPMTKGRELLATQAAVARIFEGESAQRGRYEYMASLRTVGTNKHFCGGVLIEPGVVLTAAHCVDRTSRITVATPNPKIVIGGHEVNRDESGEVHQVCSTIIHSGWDQNVQNGYDIALLILKSPASKRPISFTQLIEVPEGQRVSALGWGYTGSKKSSPPELQIVRSLVSVSVKSCSAHYDIPVRAQSLLMCADGSMGEDTCQGDSGGPLFLERGNGADELIGITSFGSKQCGIIGVPGVYTKISNFRAWIDKKGQRESNIINVPFCKGGPSPPSRKDRLAALLADRNIDSAAILIGEMVAAGEIRELGSTIAEVSRAGLAEIAVEAMLKAAQNGVSEEILAKVMNIATNELPGTDIPVSSGGGVTLNENRIVSKIRNGDVFGAADSIADAIKNSNSEAVLQAIRKSISQGKSSVVGDVLEAAIRAKGVDAAELATVLSPLCGSDEQCASFLMKIAKT